MNVHVLELKFNFTGKEETLCPVLMEQGDELILVDCGYEGFMPLIEAAVHQHGFSLEKLTGLIITHHDMDHMGAAFELKTKYPSVTIYSSAIEAPYISGKLKSERLRQAENLYDSLPEDQKPGARYFQQMLQQIKPVEVDYTLTPIENPSFLKSAQIIFTPGHMPGHISIYIKESKILIAADALVYENGEFEIANPHFTLDLAEAVASIKKLQALDIDTIICYHGGTVEKDIQAKLSRLISTYAQY
ncbi:MBL fold metallo-hydrolase [Rhodocytophaga rosea]|uniref:MBL fold metallo-hydrolase n=1 Tax=Rhodocytophaga rosea TaxID=2704465 RepID=A0A6C0GEM0_9BACT|nr:MBL fold metallo-hydrolase [Rhodocytophaga rosea]QHT66459.1 MBL fold metallo-hydrolase [Rhodocytophaga rosea]